MLINQVQDPRQVIFILFYFSSGKITRVTSLYYALLLVKKILFVISLSLQRETTITTVFVNFETSTLTGTRLPFSRGKYRRKFST